MKQFQENCIYTGQVNNVARWQVFQDGIKIAEERRPSGFFCFWLGAILEAGSPIVMQAPDTILVGRYTVKFHQSIWWTFGWRADEYVAEFTVGDPAEPA